MEEKETKELQIKFDVDGFGINMDCLPAIRTYVEDITAPYVNALVTEEGLKDAKKDLASLRKVATTIDSERKRMKAVWNMPYKYFEEELGKATEPLMYAISHIDGQVRNFEANSQKSRETEVEEGIRKDAADMSQSLGVYISNQSVWSRLFRKEYTNKTYSRNKAQEQWRADLRQIMMDLEAIGSDELTKGYYTQCGNLAQAQNQAKSERLLQEAVAKVKAKEEAKDASAYVAYVANEPANEKNTEENVANEPANVANEEEENPFTTDGKNFQYFTTLPPKDAEVKLVKATRTFGGEKWKILRLFEYAEALGLEVIR